MKFLFIQRQWSVLSLAVPLTVPFGVTKLIGRLTITNELVSTLHSFLPHECSPSLSFQSHKDKKIRAL